jgi:hypothetical protein
MTRGSWHALFLVTGMVFRSPAVRADENAATLGAPCASNEDCASGLECWTAPPAGTRGSGPANGVCTLACTVDAECKSREATALCVNGRCMEGCAIDVPARSPGNPLKCHERADMACSVRACFDEPACNHSVAACVPLCSTDQSCGTELFCDRATGLCSGAPPEGAAPGSACDLASPDNGCFGVCDLDPQVRAIEGRLAGRCVEPCVIGVPAACGSADRACIGSFYVTREGHAPGDRGVCIDLCNCSSDCADGFVCTRVGLGDVTDALGICQRGPLSRGAPDCLGAGGAPGAGAGGAACEDGPVRACRAGECLGTAECLPDGSYGGCQCLERGEGGSGGALVTNDGRTVAAGCGCRAASDGARSDAIGVWLVLGLLASVRRGTARRGSRPIGRPVQLP